MGIDAMVAANRPLWDEEAAVCRAYFASPRRTAATDRRWLALQAAKELREGVLERMAWVGGTTPTPAEWVAHTRQWHEEATHHAAFVAAHDALGPALVDLPPESAWPANVALRALRAEHRERHGRLGTIAHLVTEGGRGALFREGAALAGRGGADEVVAAACRAVLDDELDHHDDGLAAVAAAGLDAAGWDLLVELTVAQSQHRIAMRAEQLAVAP